MTLTRVPIDYYELSEKYKLHEWVEENIEHLIKVRENLKKEIDKLWRQERKVFPPWTAEEKRIYEELVRRRMELERLRSTITYRWLRRERALLKYIPERMTLLPFEFYEVKVIDNLVELYEEISERLTGFEVEPEHEYWVALKGWTKDPIDISELKKNRLQFIEAWARIHTAEHTFSTPGKGGRERHFEGYLDTKILFAYARYTGEGFVAWVMEDNRVTDLVDYFSRLFESLLLQDEDTAFIIRQLGLTGEDFIGGIDVKEIYISTEMVERVDFYMKLYDHDYDISRMEVDATLPRYYWIISPERLAEEIYAGEIERAIVKRKVTPRRAPSPRR